MLRQICLSLSVALLACGGELPRPAQRQPSTATDLAPTPWPAADGGAPDLLRDPDDTTPAHLCGADPPASAELAPPLPSYQGTCPQLVAGRNAIVSSGVEREFLLALPSDPRPGERFPVIFFWHWLKGSAQKVLQRAEVQQAADQQRFIAVLPESKKDLSLFGFAVLPWPFTIYLADERMEEEFAFFDDMLACVAGQHEINAQCVSTVGVSAGALFSAQLVAGRSQHLSSFVSLSGGVGGEDLLVNSYLKGWGGAVHKLPAVVLWGGPADSCVMLGFEDASLKLEQHLVADGHFVVECVHNCAHGEPPVDPVAGRSRYSALWDFILDHPYWLADGASPYLEQGLPAGFVPWCGIGPGSATPRVGECPEPGCPF